MNRFSAGRTPRRSFSALGLLHYNPRMLLRRSTLRVGCSMAVGLVLPCFAQQAPPSPSTARVLLLPRRMVAGEKATLAVLDANGRLVSGVSVTFSQGDHVTTDATGRAVLVAPLNPGVIFASIGGRPGRVATAVLTALEASASSPEIASAPQFASLADRFEILGKGFCGDADANQVKVAGRSALLLASSPVALTILPPPELDSGDATVEISCAKRDAPAFTLTFVELNLEADSSSLKPGEHRPLIVRVRGTQAKVPLEAQNLAPAIADLNGGNSVATSSSGGAQNLARFQITGRKNGSFQIAIRLASPQTHPY